MTPSQNYRIHTKTIKKLRAFERKRKLQPSISKTIETMIEVIEEYEKLIPH
jgi:hypothetical protein